MTFDGQEIVLFIDSLPNCLQGLDKFIGAGHVVSIEMCLTRRILQTTRRHELEWFVEKNRKQDEESAGSNCSLK